MKQFKEREETCLRCGDTFITSSNNAKYCPKCRVDVIREYSRRGYHRRKGKPKRPLYESHSSICWGCANAVPDPINDIGCSWSIEFKPVEGWEAIQKKNSYNVWKCPEFKRG